MFETRKIPNRMLAYLALGGMAAPFIFAVLVTVGGALSEGYSHGSQAISELGGVDAEHPFIQNANFFVVGVLITAFAFGLHQSIGRGRGSKLGPILIGIFGIIATAHAFLPCDTGCEFETVIGTMHNVTGMVGFLAVTTGIVSISRRVREDPHWRSYAAYSLFTGLAALVAIILWIGVSKAAGVDAANGSLQRVFVGIVFLWIGVMATRLFWVAHRASEPN